MTRDQLIFRAEIWVRYHKSRAEHFAARNTWISIITIFAGTGVVAGYVATNPILYLILGIVIAFLNTVRMVTKPGQLCAENTKLSKAWFKFKGEVEADDELTEEQRKLLVKRANELESQCLDDMRALTACCFNDAITALGRAKKPYKISRLQKWTKNLFKHTHAFDNQNQAFAKADVLEKALEFKKQAARQRREEAKLARAAQVARPRSVPPDGRVPLRDGLERGSTSLGAEMGAPA